MARSVLKMHFDSSSEDATKKLINRCIEKLDRPPIESSITKHSKEGYLATLEFFHNDSCSWSDVVVEVIDFGQRLGSGWKLFGNISSELNAVLSKDIADHISVSGLQWVELHISNENQT